MESIGATPEKTWATYYGHYGQRRAPWALPRQLLQLTQVLWWASLCRELTACILHLDSRCYNLGVPRTVKSRPNPLNSHHDHVYYYYFLRLLFSFIVTAAIIIATIISMAIIQSQSGWLPWLLKSDKLLHSPTILGFRVYRA